MRCGTFSVMITTKSFVQILKGPPKRLRDALSKAGFRLPDPSPPRAADAVVWLIVFKLPKPLLTRELGLRLRCFPHQRQAHLAQVQVPPLTSFFALMRHNANNIMCLEGLLAHSSMDALEILGNSFILTALSGKIGQRTQGFTRMGVSDVLLNRSFVGKQNV